MPVSRVSSSIVSTLVLSVVLALLGLTALTNAADAQAEDTTHSIVIRAWGDTGDERMELVVGDQSIKKWNIGETARNYAVSFDAPTEESSIAVRFINDVYEPPYDRNLTVDYIVLDDVKYETEAQTVLSSGSFNPTDGCKGGYKRSQKLSCEGQFVYDIQVGGTIDGTGGGEPVPVEGVIEHCGEIAADEQWLPSSVHVVTCPVTITNDATLSIVAGSIVKYEPEETGAEIIVGNGASLDVEGSSTDPVIFTSNYDSARGGDTNGERSDSTLRPGRYGTAITISPGSTTTIKHALIDYASVGIGDLGSASNKPALLKMTKSQIQNSLYLGANFDEPQSEPAIQKTAFVDNGHGALRLADDAKITDVLLVGNSANTFVGAPGNRRFYLSSVTVPSNAAWSYGPESGAALVLERDRSLAVNGRLSIRAGSIVKVSTNSDTAGLFANQGGVIRISGTKAAPVTITSVLDDSVGGDTNADGSTSVPRPGRYPTGITMAAGSSVAATHSTIRYAENGVAGEATNGSQPASLVLSNSVLSNNAYFGLHLDKTKFAATVSRSTFANNGLGGARIAKDSPVSRFAMSGTGANTFTGDAQSRQLWLAGASLPNRIQWTFSPSTGATLSLERFKSFVIAGQVDLEPGSTAKISSNSRQSGFHVVNGGALQLSGTSADPVVLTSILDDSVAGDSNGDGSDTAPKAGSYRTAVRVSPGATFTGSNVEIGYSRIAIADTKTAIKKPAIIQLKNSEIHNARYFGIQIDRPRTEVTFQRTTIRDSTTAIMATKGELRFRGSILNVEDGIRACDFGKSCEVDARYADWGDARGPFKTTGEPLVCGEVSIGSWKDQPAAANGTNFVKQNCDGSTP